MRGLLGRRGLWDGGVGLGLLHMRLWADVVVGFGERSGRSEGRRRVGRRVILPAYVRLQKDDCRPVGLGNRGGWLLGVWTRVKRDG